MKNFISFEQQQQKKGINKARETQVEYQRK